MGREGPYYMHPCEKQDIVTYPRKLRTGYCDIPNTVPKQREKNGFEEHSFLGV